MLLWFEESPGVWRLREAIAGESGGQVDPEVWTRRIYPPLTETGTWPECANRPIHGRGASVGPIIGAGDTTTVISDPSDKTRPYRFKEGTKSGQKAEIRKVMEERFQRDNKAPWKVNVDVAEN